MQAVILTETAFPNTQTVRGRKSIGCPQELGPAVPADNGRKGYQAGDR